MFDPTKEVLNLELCKRLKELGFPQDGSSWYWVRVNDDAKEMLEWKTSWNLVYKEGLDEWLGWRVTTKPHITLHGCGCCECTYDVVEYIAAPTSRELGEWFPAGIAAEKLGKKWIVYDNTKDRRYDNHQEADNNQPNAYAKMVLWLVEKRYILLPVTFKKLYGHNL